VHGGVKEGRQKTPLSVGTCAEKCLQPFEPVGEFLVANWSKFNSCRVTSPVQTTETYFYRVGRLALIVRLEAFREAKKPYMTSRWKPSSPWGEKG
jgi:hypothetical protein